MNILKKHLFNIIGAGILALSISGLITDTARIVIHPGEKTRQTAQKVFQADNADKITDYNFILNSNFFQLSTTQSSENLQSASPANLVLLGTVTGSPSLARAMIRSASENKVEIFKIGSSAWGYTLIRILKTKVLLKSGSSEFELDMLKTEGGSSNQQSNSQSSSKRTISRAELLTKIQGNMDNMLKGMRAGPYREDGQIKGYKIMGLSKDNMLYELGIRQGDIIMRINGHPIDSTQKLFELWQKLPQEPKALIDIKRGNDTTTLDYTFSN
ncbi:MAG TPA: hypothetical protein PK419_04380 [Spirochaetota bacterium]|mgnify:FL=1|jgi:type II secretion system protein C|nr:hypothetical protein [Spirochaetota bacterium]HOH37893.1 hypothetical protein [Spirochaetota bacterium]HPY02137.1 hypothetical protein [Spirochaetota bacterium]HQA52072.1 hypothetical protein [Spirochaetota bacterium]